MKKVLSILVAISLLFAVAVPAFAGENVDALTDAQQKEIATLTLESINKGNDVETAMGRSNIKKDVIAGIKDFTPYKIAAKANPDSIKITVSLAITAVKEDVDFSENTAGMLSTLIAKAIIDKAVPNETSTEPVKPDDSNSNNSEDIQYIVDMLSNLSYDAIKTVLTTLLGNGAITAEEAKAIVDELYNNGAITLDEKRMLNDIINNQNTKPGDIFQGYTPTDLAELFRGFGNAINYITSGLADLLRSAGGSGDDPNASDNPNGSQNSASPEIPPTGDHAVTAVASVALVAGLALVLTRKKKED